MAGFVAKQDGASLRTVPSAVPRRGHPVLARCAPSSRLLPVSSFNTTAKALQSQTGLGRFSVQILAGVTSLISMAPLLAQAQQAPDTQRWNKQLSPQAAQSQNQLPGPRAPVWELLPPPPLPALETSQPIGQDSISRPPSGQSVHAGARQAGSGAPTLLHLAASDDSKLRYGGGVVTTQQATSGLTPVSGFPTVSSTGYGTSLIWELAPSPLSDKPLASAEPLPVPADTASSQPQPPQSSARHLHSSDDIELSQSSTPANLSGLRWELLDDVGELTAEAPDPEQLTVPVAERYTPPYLLSPYIGGGIPSAYVAGWGDFYISGSAATPGKLRDGVVDGSFNIGLGVGDADKLVALEIDWGSGSIKNFNFNGGFSAAVGRNILRNDSMQLSISGGVIDIYEYGNEVDEEPASPYGVISLTIPLRPSDPVFQQNVQFSLGGGGAAFAPVDDNFVGPDSGVFASLGLEISRNAGISAAWSGRGVNANLSLVPFRDIPISINVLAADLFDQTPTGTVGVLSLTWGSNFASGVF